MTLSSCAWNSDPKLEVQRQRLSSVVAVDLLPSLEGMELGSYGKVSCVVKMGGLERVGRRRGQPLPLDLTANKTLVV